jgi:chorismate mutase
MTIRAVRGAITVEANTREAILAAAGEMLQTLIDRNGITPESVVSAIFSATDDLTADYPAEKAREMGWTQAGLMCVGEMRVEGSLRACLRVLVLWETDKPQAEMQHSYLRGASGLRPDLD